MAKKTPTLLNEAFTVDGFSKSSSLLWCSGLRMALFCRCNALTPKPTAPHSAAPGPLVLDKSPDWGGSDTPASDHQSILIPPSWWTNGSREGCPNHKSDYRCDSTQNRWIVFGFAMMTASLVSQSHHPFYYLGASQTDAPQAILPSPLCVSPSLRAYTLLWTVSRVSYWCNWKCFVIAFSQTLMDVKLNEVWVLVIRVSLCEIYHQRLKRLQGTIKAPPPSTSQ